MNNPTPTPQQYIFDDTEVRLTGRHASRNCGRTTEHIVEITPASIDDGTWKRWVRPTELYVISDVPINQLKPS